MEVRNVIKFYCSLRDFCSSCGSVRWEDGATVMCDCTAVRHVSSVIVLCAINENQ
jgi:hypothetical protein